MSTGEQLFNIRSENGFYSTLTITFQKGQLQKGSQQEKKKPLQRDNSHNYQCLLRINNFTLKFYFLQLLASN